MLSPSWLHFGCYLGQGSFLLFRVILCLLTLLSSITPYPSLLIPPSFIPAYPSLLIYCFLLILPSCPSLLRLPFLSCPPDPSLSCCCCCCCWCLFWLLFLLLLLRLLLLRFLLILPSLSFPAYPCLLILPSLSCAPHPALLILPFLSFPAYPFLLIFPLLRFTLFLPS